MYQSNTSSSSSLALPFPTQLPTVPRHPYAQVVSDPGRYSVCIRICGKETLNAMDASDLPWSRREHHPEKKIRAKERIFIVEKQNEPSLQPLLLTVPQVAKRLGLSRAMIYVLINREGLPVIRLGRAVRISVTSLQKWIEQHEQSSTDINSSQEDGTPTRVSDAKAPFPERSSQYRLLPTKRQ